jgi:colanic acid biosynthesis protein WcaH
MHIPEDIYAQIVHLMPIPCVDLLVEDLEGRILLIKRANDPAKGQWWFPGGRVHYLETRMQAARRKLKEECGLESFQIKEMGTYDVILDMPGDEKQRHGITTLFHIMVRKQGDVILDSQSHDSDWRTPDEWLSENLHFIIKQGIALLSKESDSNAVRRY